jgi:ankyrin repeat protein
VKLLLEKGADVNAREGVRGVAVRARTPLMLATRRGLLDVVNLLLTKGADVNARDEDGRTALMWAADSESDSSETVKILLIKGANPDVRDNDGATALSWAQKRGETPLVILLKKTGYAMNDL